eukprot:CAMPEP_0114490952 /NCGR_PEP_ID=MMETSP0109-20121206/2730_1 /TAXON_ID=29199 /ORGANISM="Chlorarachnion reptans, Strain CCCM449" /LENGTH=79 /DNA_ID=CAMNT_0001667631 /DNA_START=577 /DNA_END=812 /DNA_ORIENTATION=+
MRLLELLLFLFVPVVRGVVHFQQLAIQLEPVEVVDGDDPGVPVLVGEEAVPFELLCLPIPDESDVSNRTVLFEDFQHVL